MEWKEVGSKHIRTIQKKRKRKGVNVITWVSGITEILYNFVQAVWYKLNGDRHGRDKTEKDKLLDERALI